MAEETKTTAAAVQRPEDAATLRRELFNKRLLHRTADGASYWRAEDIPPLAAFMAQYI